MVDQTDASPTTLVELVRVTTGDGLRLDGALALADRQTDPHALADAAILIHGTGSNFYGSSLIEALADKLRAVGISALRINTRGHDGMSTASSASGAVAGGAAYEIVDHCRLDLAAWSDFLASRGYARLLLVGHSLGALKAIHFLTQEQAPAVRGLVAVSPPRLSYARFAAGPKAETFLAAYRQAEQLVAAGQADGLMPIEFPIPYLISARGYLDKYGADERYNITRNVQRLPVPALVTYGSVEVQSNPAFQELPEEIERLTGEHALPVRIAVVAGADHFYAGCRSELLARVARWLKSH